jgi:hypothetical protein
MMWQLLATPKDLCFEDALSIMYESLSRYNEFLGVLITQLNVDNMYGIIGSLNSIRNSLMYSSESGALFCGYLVRTNCNSCSIMGPWM